MSMHPFDSLMELAAPDIRLDCAALHMARDTYPDLDVARYLAKLDQLADEVAELRPGLSAPLRYVAMRTVLVERHGFGGDEEDYYDPQNSYLNRVLDRGVGIPISLSAIWIEVGRRLNWPVAGVGLPGHFVIRFDDPERFVLVDPFCEGRTLSLEDCEKLVNDFFEQKTEFSEELLEPTDVRAILGRMLNNLHKIYATNHDWDRLVDILRRQTAVDPTDARARRELAILLYRRGSLHDAHAHLSEFLLRHPDSDDAGSVRRELASLEAALAALN